MNPIVLSIQSEVVYGHVGHRASRFILERLGCIVWSVPTVLFSNHLGKKSWRGRKLTPRQVADLIDGLDALGVLAQVACVFSGYLGAAQIVPIVAQTVRRVKAANPTALYACDPVLGDDGNLYVPDDLAAGMATDLLPLADILLPNSFELQYLSGRRIDSSADADSALNTLAHQVPACLLLVTGIVDPRHPDRISARASIEGAIKSVEARRFALSVSGTGDAFAALFLADYLKHRDAPAALARAIQAMEIIAAATEKAGGDELKIVETQKEWAAAMGA